MTTTRHTISATRSGSHPAMGDWDAEYTITFTYLPGAGPTGPTYASGGEPGWGPEIEFVAIEPDAGDHGAFTDLAQAGLVDWARNWLDENAAECAEIAERDSQPDPDAARDARIDDGLTEVRRMARCQTDLKWGDQMLRDAGVLPSDNTETR